MRRLFAIAMAALMVGVLAGCEFFVQTVAPTPTLISAPPSQLQRPMVEVKRGRLEEAIRMTGRVEADTRQDLFFKAPGRIKNVRVRQGDTVNKDDILAELETGGLESDVADAEKALETAELKLKAGEADFADAGADAKQALLLAENDVAAKQRALDELMEGPTDAELAAARATVSAAKANLEGLTRGATESQLATAQSSVATAAAAYNSARADLDEIQGSLEEIIAAARADVASKEAAVAAARARLPYPDGAGTAAEAAALREAEGQIAGLEAQVAAQRAAFYQAEADLNDLQNKPTPQQRLEAENAFAKAKLTHDSVVSGGASYETKQQAEIVFQEATRAYNDALAPASEAELRVANNTVAMERAALLELEAQLQQVLGAGTREEAVQRLAKQVKGDYEAEVAAAELALALARRRLNIAESPAGPEELQRARDATSSAGAGLNRAQAGLDELQAPADPLELSAAEEKLKNAEAILKELESGPDEADLQAARNSLEAATIKRDDAQRKLAEFESGESAMSIDLTILRNTVEQNKIRLERLREQTFENQVIAPFAGEITYVRGRPGDQVAAYQEIIGLADPSVLVVEAVVPEVDQPKLAVGQDVAVTIDQFPGVNFLGRVGSLPRTIVSSTGQAIKIPETEITVDWGRPGIELGMLARLKIVIQVKDDVLKVPIPAVRTVNRRDFVETVVGEQRRSLPVTIGIRSDTEVEIESGLEEGVMVFASP